MRLTRSILLILFVLLAGCAPAGTAVSTPLGTPVLPDGLTPVSVSPSIYQFTMLDANLGWAVTLNRVIRTLDGGQSWYDVTPPAVQADIGYSPFFSLDAGHAWLVVVDPVNPTGGTLYRTADGGLSWQTSPTPFGYSSLQFLDASNGWCLASLGAGAGSEAVALYQTANGGETWIQVFNNAPDSPSANESLPLTGQKNGVAFLDLQRGWIGGSQPQDGYVWLFVSQDGGRSWMKVDLALPAGAETSMTNVFEPVFFSKTEGVLPVSLLTPQSLSMVFYATQDGGSSWSATTPVSSFGVYAFISPRQGFLWDGGILYVTRDGGTTWAGFTPNLDLTGRVMKLQFVDDKTGWVLGSDLAGSPVLYRTLDGGLNWTAVAPLVE